MSDHTGPGRGQQALIFIASVVIAVAGIKAIEPILTPVLLASFVALVITPMVRWLQNHRLPRWVAMLVVVLGALVLLGALSLLVASSVSTLQDRLPSYESSLRRQIGIVVDGAGDLLERFDIDLQEDVIKDGLDPGTVFLWAQRAVIASGNLLSNTLFVIALAAFMLGEATILPAKLRVIQQSPTRRIAFVDDFRQSILGYVQIKAMTSAATGCLVTLACSVFGVDFAVLWGLLAFGLNFVPNIGSILAAVPAVVLAFVIGGLQPALLLAGCYLAINITIGTVVEPKLMGERVGLSTLAVLLSLVFWGWVLGLVGMLLSVPLTMAVKLAMDESEDLRWIGTLLGPEPATSPPPPPPEQ